MIINQLIHGSWFIIILGRKRGDLPHVFRAINDFLILIDPWISNDAIIHVSDDQILIYPTFKPLVFNLLKVEVWLIRCFFTVVVSVKSGRVNFTDVIQIYGMYLLSFVICASWWLYEAWLHDLYLLCVFALVVNVLGEELLPLLSIWLLSIIDSNHFAVVSIQLASRMFAGDRMMFRSLLNSKIKVIQKGLISNILCTLLRLFTKSIRDGHLHLVSRTGWRANEFKFPAEFFLDSLAGETVQI